MKTINTSFLKDLALNWAVEKAQDCPVGGVGMSKLQDGVVRLSETLTLCDEGHLGFRLWDKTLDVNLSIGAKSSTDALVEAIHYYQRRLTKANQEHALLKTKVDAFVAQFILPGCQ